MVIYPFVIFFVGLKILQNKLKTKQKIPDDEDDSKLLKTDLIRSGENSKKTSNDDEAMDETVDEGWFFVIG